MVKKAFLDCNAVKSDCEDAIYIATQILNNLQEGNRFIPSDYWDLKHIVSHLGGLLRSGCLIGEEEE
jgi:hypothetical protein